ncbi:multidrug effflux MFS transporter [Brevibacillus fulvus]|uniref:Bcr/CflA family efflux transporter n=1 Tax=Brevibacillus fulvus TaxID=1125967 RepID=A0A938Y0S1_9BACL|nr:multidrug effflux MFS transporter [Brevibacillus fulvus]MBM7590339.1 DHA1 family bicyclomycin/chloramphenicol resistance-like MFS transporter [Brevibacillus fulvus]
MNDMEVASAAPVRTRRLWMAVILGALSAFGPLSLDMYLPSLPRLAEELHTSASTAQLSLTACLLGLSLGQLLAGPVSDVRGRRKPLLIGLAIYCVSSFLCAMTPTIWGLILLRFMQGAAGAAGIVLSRAMARDMYAGPELTRFFSLLMLVNGVAPIFAPIAGGQLLQITSWQGVFVVLGLIGLIMFLVVAFGLPETLPAQKRSSGGLKNTFATFGGLLTDRVFMGFALSQGLVIAAMFAYISGSPFVLQDIYGMSPQMFSLCFAVNGVGIIIAGQMTGRLAARLGEVRLLAAGLALASISGILLLLMILLKAGLIGILLPLFIVVSCVGIVSTSAFSLAMQNQAKSAGSASALLGVLSFIFGGLVAPLVGLGGSQTAIPMGVVIAAAEVGSVLCYLGLAGRRRTNEE